MFWTRCAPTFLLLVVLCTCRDNSASDSRASAEQLQVAGDVESLQEAQQRIEELLELARELESQAKREDAAARKVLDLGMFFEPTPEMGQALEDRKRSRERHYGGAGMAYEDAIRIAVRAYGFEALEVAELVNRLAGFYARAGGPARATYRQAQLIEALYHRRVALQEHGPGHPVVVRPALDTSRLIWNEAGLNFPSYHFNKPDDEFYAKQERGLVLYQKAMDVLAEADPSPPPKPDLRSSDEMRDITFHYWMLAGSLRVHAAGPRDLERANRSRDKSVVLMDTCITMLERAMALYEDRLLPEGNDRREREEELVALLMDAETSLVNSRRIRDKVPPEHQKLLDSVRSRLKGLKEAGVTEVVRSRSLGPPSLTREQLAKLIHSFDHYCRRYNASFELINMRSTDRLRKEFSKYTRGYAEMRELSDDEIIGALRELEERGRLSKH